MQGSKRSRPPPELMEAKSPEKEKRAVSPPEIGVTRRSTRLNGIEQIVNGVKETKKTVVEEVSDEERQPLYADDDRSTPAGAGTPATPEPEPNPELLAKATRELGSVPCPAL